MLRTKQQEKSICGGCSTAKTANLIGDTCTLLIIRDLLAAPKRFGDFETSLKGVSSRTLTKKLQFLEEKGLIERQEVAAKPPHAVYSLTKNGKALRGVIETMESYGRKFL